jgi:hypothetical protein
LASLFWPGCAYGPVRQPLARGHAHEKRIRQFVERLLLALANQLREKLDHLPEDLLGRPPLFVI